MILIKDARVIDPQSGLDDILDMIIEDNKIVKIGKYQRGEEYETIIEASGMIAAPGLIDVHVHFRDPGFTYKEDMETGAGAAAKGGYTTVVCMANTNPCIDNAEALEYVLERAKKARINVLPAACITKGMEGKELVDMEELIKKGAVGFTDDGKPLTDRKVVWEAMKKAAKLQVPLSFHEEDPIFITNNGINEGEIAVQLGLKGSPAIAEDIMVARDCMLALHTNAVINIQHISSKNAVKMVRLAKSMGAGVIAEATPHHFSMTQEALLTHRSNAKMNPPLRRREDRYEIIEGLKDNTIDIIATDHAPHSREEKDKALAEAPSGIIGLETALALGITNLVRRGHLTMIQLMEKMSLNPAKLYHLDKGHIEEGAVADLVIFNEKEISEVKDFVSKSANSPFLGEKLYGKVKYTICNGKIVFKDKE